MTDNNLRDYLRNAIADIVKLPVDDVHVFFDASRESTIAVVVRDNNADTYFCDAGSDDDDYRFVIRDYDDVARSPYDILNVPFPDNAHEGTDHD